MSAEKDREKEIKRPPDFRRDLEPRRVFFTWDITYDCNYRCTYCSLGYEEERARKPKTVILKPEKWMEIWSGIYERYGSAQVHLSGGEPFCYPGIMDIVEGLVSMHTFECSTNLSWDVKEFSARVPPDRARIGTSFHPQMVSFDEFLGKVLELRDAGYEVWSNYVAYPPFIKDLGGAKKRFSSEGINMSILTFEGVYEGKSYPDGYSEEEIRYLRELGADLPWVRKSMNWTFDKEKYAKGPRKCLMGVMYAKIHPDGNAYRCCAQDPVKLGNLFDGTFELLEEAAMCDKEACPCWKSMIGGEEDRWADHWVVPRAARLQK
ncbi:MAG: radical SAM protein [Elusimicrobia bacterium]|nr:radical SAM protein [Elusimicrobiota bacterium]